MRWIWLVLLLGCSVGLEEASVAVYPNPCYGDKVVFKGDLAFGRIEIYNIQGRLVRVLEAEDEEVVWDTRDEEGRKVPSGVYVWRFEGPSGRCSGRITILTSSHD